MNFFEKELKVRLTFTEEILGSSPASQEIYREYIASKAPDAPTIEDEIAAVGVDETADAKMTVFERPLRAQTAQGERVALSASESIPAGAQIEFTIGLLDAKLEDVVREWLDYGELSGFGQWHSSGKGRFTWEEVK